MAEIQKGARFATYEDFHLALKRNEVQCGVLYVTKSSKKLKKDSQYLETLKYESISFACKQGKRNKESRSQGIRPNQRTFKLGCPSFINLLVVDTGDDQYLKVTKCNLVHENHPTGKEVSQLYPENRKATMSSPLKTLLSMKSVSVKDIKEMVQTNEGIQIFSQDVRNWKKKLYCQESQEETEKVEEILEHLQAEGGVFRFGMNESGEFKFLAFMTQDMLRTLNQFPEVLVMDSTYKVNKNNYPLLNILVIDGNGQGRPVFHALLASEDTLILSSCLSFFASSFTSNLVETVFVDKDMAEICAIRTCLPDVCVRLCAFHTATAVRKALQQRKLPTPQISCILELFAEQKSCSSLSQYNVLREKISDISPPEVVSYFETNWWNCPQLWATYLIESTTFHVNTTNHAETFHQKIKQVLTSKTPLSVCINELIRMTKSTMETRDASACIHSISLKYNTKHNSDIVNIIQNDLTPFGARIVTEQFLLSKKTQYLFQCSLTCPDTYILSSSTPGSSSYDCTIHSCSCDFFFKFHLPCRHIFALRSDLCLPIYHCDNERFKGTPVNSPFLASNDHGITHEVIPTRNASTPESRYHLTRELTKAIDSFLPLLGEHAFQTALSHLNRVFFLVKSDRPVAVIDLSELPELASSLSSESLGAPSVSAESLGAPSVSAQILGAPSVSAESLGAPSVSAQILGAPSVSAESLGAPSVSAQILGAPSVSAESLGAPSVSAQILGAPSVSAESLGAPSVSAQILGAPSVSAESLGAPSVSAQILGAPSVSAESLGAPSVSAQILGAPSVSAESLGAPSVSAQILGAPSVSAQILGASSPAVSSCGFANVKLSLVKTKGRPRQTQSFTRRYGKRKACPQDYNSRINDVKRQLLLSGCLIDLTVLPPYSVSNVKPAAHISSIFANENISFTFMEDLFVPEAWETLQARVAEKKEKDLFSCNSCTEMDNGEFKMIECEGCLEWYHYHCVGLRTNSKSKKWFCIDCWK